jgi:HEPN domain-containing protein
MSLEKNRQEAERWLKTAEGDLETAVILQENKKYAHSCFHSQQAGEKAISR